MASVLNRTTKQFRTSVHTDDFPTVDWIINPDLSAVVGFASKYWIITGDVVTLMTNEAPDFLRDAIDAAVAAANEAANRVDEKARYDNERALKAIVLLVIDEINILRAQHGLADRTPAQAKTAFDNKVDVV